MPAGRKRSFTFCIDILETRSAYFEAWSYPELWRSAPEEAAKVDRNAKMVMAFMGTSIVEQC